MSSTDSPASLQATLEQAQAYLAAGLSEEALATTSHLLSVLPNAVRIWRVRAAALAVAGRADESAAAWLRVLDVIPDDAAALTGCADALRAAGRAVEASELSRQALDHAAQEPDAHTVAQPEEDADVARITVARNQFAAGLINRALAHVRGILEAQPTRADALAVLADMLWHSGVRHITAELCRNLLAVQPNCLAAHAILAAYGRRTSNFALYRIHAAAVADFDPDYREIAARLGSAVPFEITDVEVPTERVESPTTEHIEPPTTERVESPTTERVESPTTERVESPTTERVESPTTEHVESPTTEHVESPTTERVEPPTTEHVESPTTGDPAQRPEWVEEIVAAAEAEAEIAAASAAPKLEWSAIDDEQPMDDAARAPEPAPQQPNTVRVAAPELQPRATSDENIVVEPLDWSHNDEDFTIVDPPPAPAASKARKQSRPTRSSKARPEEMLQNARSALVEGRIDEAAEIYGNLITKGKLLDEIIDDLDAAALTLPTAKRLHELLGQAHTRKGNIPAALEAYRKAMQE